MFLGGCWGVVDIARKFQVDWLVARTLLGCCGRLIGGCWVVEADCWGIVGGC